MDLQELHKSLSIRHGTFDEEIIEQRMASMFIGSGDTVLELGSNIGRNSLVIGSILNSSDNLVTLEMDPVFHAKCKENRDLNGLKFHCVNKALSYSPLYAQFNKKHGEGGGYCVPTKHTPDYTECPRATLEELEREHGKQFNAIVCDCEGGLYYILKDNPNLFEHMNKVILENDFPCIEHKEHVDGILAACGFKRVFVEALPVGDWPCKEFFWETWTK